MRTSLVGVLIALLGAAVGVIFGASMHDHGHTDQTPEKARVYADDPVSGRDGGVGGNLLPSAPLQLDSEGPGYDDCESCHLPFVPFFGTPAGINCEIDYRRADLPDSAYCMSVQPAQHVSMNTDGELSICRDSVDCLSDPPFDQPILRFGQSAEAGPFNCRSEAEGVTCTVSPSERGFTISPSGIEPVG